MIIDAHTHFYDPSRPQGAPWPPQESALWRPVLPPEFRSKAGPCGVTGTVVVEASPWVDDNDWVLALADAEPELLGLIGRIDPGDPDFAAHLDRLTAYRRFRGIRLSGQAVDASLRSPRFAEQLRRLAEHGLTLDLNVSPEVLEYVLAAARPLPELRIVVDHMAGSDRPDGRPSVEVQETLRRIADRPRSWCKLSGFVEAAARHHDPVPSHADSYRPMFDALREILGPQRLMYASNWPVSELYAPYETVFEVARCWIDALDDEDQAAIWHRNAFEAYGLDEPRRSGS